MNIDIHPLPNKRIDDLTGKQMGRLTILGFTGIEKRGKNTVATWLAKCICGNVTKVVSGQFNRGHHLSCGCLQLENNTKIRETAVRNYRASKGQNPDIPMTSVNQQERKKLTELMAAIKKRDGYTCQLCGARGTKLHTHHIRTFSECITMRDDPKNLITLCKNCHFYKAHSGSYKKVSNYYSEIFQDKIKTIYSAQEC